MDTCIGPLRSLITLYLKGKPGESYNIGSGKNMKNIVLVKKILKFVN